MTAPAFNLEFDMLEASDMLGRYGRQIPFATKTAINRSAEDFQRFQRNHMENVYTVRRKTWVKRSVRIKPFASKQRLRAEVSIFAPGGRSDILAKFEAGERKRAKDGGHVAVPIDAKRTKRGIISKSQRPGGFHFQRKGRRIVGRRGTFLIPGVGIFQRTGQGRRLASSLATRKVRDVNIRLLYSLKKSVHTPKNLRFVANAEKVVPRVFEGHLRSALRKAVRTARR